MLGLGKLTSNTVQVHDALCWVVVTQNLSIEPAQTLGFILSELVSDSQAFDLFDEIMIGLLVAFGIRQLRTQSE